MQLEITSPGEEVPGAAGGPGAQPVGVRLRGGRLQAGLTHAGPGVGVRGGGERASRAWGKGQGEEIPAPAQSPGAFLDQILVHQGGWVKSDRPLLYQSGNTD